MRSRASSARSVTATRSAAGARAAPRRRKSSEVESAQLNWRLIGGLAAGLAIVGGLVAELAVLFPSGAVGEPTRRAVAQAVGWTAPLAPLWLLGLGLVGLLKAVRPEFVVPRSRIWGTMLAFLALAGLFHLFVIGGPGSLPRAQSGEGGGLLGLRTGHRPERGPRIDRGWAAAAGSARAWPADRFELRLSQVARLLFSMALLALRAARTWREKRRGQVRINTPEVGGVKGALPARLAGLVRRSKREKQARVSAVPMATPQAVEPPPLAPRLGTETWRLPPVNLFEVGAASEYNPVDAKLRARTIEETLASFNIEARVIEVNHGPTVTQFGIEPAAGVPVRKILALQNDLGLRLGAWPVTVRGAGARKAGHGSGSPEHVGLGGFASRAVGERGGRARRVEPQACSRARRFGPTDGG